MEHSTDLHPTIDMKKPSNPTCHAVALMMAGVLGLATAACGARSPQVQLTPDAVDASAGNMETFRIETPTATYHLEKVGLGLSSMIDREGNDWINFEKTPGSGAGGEFRGFPNAVYREDGSFFHPRNEGTDPSTARVEYAGDDRVTIVGASENGNWEVRWDFLPTHATFTMTKMPAGRRYWVLYEGTPGGQYDNDDWWMTSQQRTPMPLTTRHEGDIAAPEWIVFGDQDVGRVLFMAHHDDDEHPDTFYQMQEKMTVFGFGRRGLEKFLDSVPRSFSIGFVESTEHDEISGELRQLMEVR